MVLTKKGNALTYREVPDPIPNDDQLLLRVLSCGVCRTDLHILDGDLLNPKLPLILGHEIVAEVVGKGAGAGEFSIGDRVGVPWLGWACGKCYYCQTDRENLCNEAKFTGYQIDGGFAELTVASQSFCFRLDKGYSDIQAAPLMCAGLIGYRALRFTDKGKQLGIYGFGAAAHIITQVAIYEGRNVFAFTRNNDSKAQKFAIELGAVWAGSSEQLPPSLLDAAMIFAPDGRLIPLALKATLKGATVVCAGIHMSRIPEFPYDLLWGERVLRSVANLTHKDGLEFLELAPKIPIRTHTKTYPLSQANLALADLRAGAFCGTAVLIP